MRRFAYSILDVFSEAPLEGNPLAVFHDATSLSTEEMQSLARELNLAETTFILPRERAIEEREGVRVRIFTTQEELPFAGHPTLGTAGWLHAHHATLKDAETTTLALNVGPIPVRFDPRDPSKPGVRATMRQNDPVFGNTHARAEVAKIIGLSEDDLDEAHAPQTVSTGMPFCIVPLRSIEVSQRLAIPQREAQAWLADSDAKFFYTIAPTHNKDANTPQWHARMQFYSGEDPATGSAAGCCISYLVKHGLAPSAQPIVIEQGIEIHRPSRITAQATGERDSVRSVLVSGRTIHVADGVFFLP